MKAESISLNDYEAVVFDLWNTLVPLPVEVKTKAFEETASALGTTADVLRPIWSESRHERETGDLFSYVKAVCYRLGLDDRPEVIEKALQSRRSIHGTAMHSPRQDAETTLAKLRTVGLGVGLISNCTSDLPSMFKETNLATLVDEAVFSSVEGVMKPNSKIYAKVAHRLGVTPACCLYIGDGHDNELGGAAEAGMNPVLLETDDAPCWDGIRTLSLSEIMEW